VYHTKEYLKQKALDSNKVYVLRRATVFCKVHVFGEKVMKFDSSIIGPVQAKIRSTSLNFTSNRSVISKLKRVGGRTRTISPFFPLCKLGTPKLINDGY
jgi:hypothetical protein